MNKPKDTPTDIASQLLQEWQQRYANMLNDPEAIHAMLVMVDRMQRFCPLPPVPLTPAMEHPTYAPFPFTTSQQPNQQPQQQQHGGHQPQPDANDVAAAVAVLEQRLSAMEARLSRLEAAARRHNS